jgi:beta-glucosidase
MGNYPDDGEYVGTVLATDHAGIPALLYNDGPQGFRDDARPGTSTALPSGLNVAATWSTEAATLWGDVLGAEFFDKGSNVMLGPGMNVARVPRNGRNFEYMSGEDPSLGAGLVPSVIKASQVSPPPPPLNRTPT